MFKLVVCYGILLENEFKQRVGLRYGLRHNK